jgi:hypothetical protein
VSGALTALVWVLAVVIGLPTAIWTLVFLFAGGAAVTAAVQDARDKRRGARVKAARR